MTTKRLILIDGNSMLSSAFFGSVPREFYDKRPGMKEIALEKMMKTSSGQYTNGVFAMSKTLLKIFKEHSASNIAIAWDVSRKTHRRERYSEYKAHRKDTPNELGSQFGLMQKLLEVSGIKSFKYEGYEADDVIGTLAKKFENDIPVVILTKDQDALQLISEGTRVWLNTSTTKEKIKEYFGEDFPKKDYKVLDNYFEFTLETLPYFYGGLNPLQIIDLKGLEGDASDNIPGVKGCGESSIYPLLNEFGTIEAIYDYIENTPEKEIKVFLKELGITRSPLGSLLKKSNIEIADEAISLLDKDFNKKLVKEAKDLFKTVDDKEIKTEAKALSDTDEEAFIETVRRLAEELRGIDSGIVGKEAAYLSKELATINTSMEQLSNVKLEDIELKLDEDAMYKMFEELEFNSLLKNKK
ncbi:5'-3' exonuclease H3TH domain-containing protein [Priestia filamentosa]|uniref:5'-3' exonuclease n=1 Tax=Priestia filamentosa TaxID=1402861 RepID=UPI00069099A6